MPGTRSGNTGYTAVNTHKDDTSVNSTVVIVKKHKKETQFIQKASQPPLILSEEGQLIADPDMELAEGDELAVAKNRFAFRELLAGEWMRLMNPEQPKIRLRLTSNPMGKKDVYVLSKQLNGYISLAKLSDPKNYQLHPEYSMLWMQVQNGEIPGLASSSFSALSTLNSDLHLGNIGVALNKDGKHEVFVIDAGMCYFPLTVNNYKYNPDVGLKKRRFREFPYDNKCSVYRRKFHG